MTNEVKIKPNDPVQFKWNTPKFGSKEVVEMHRVLAEKMDAQGKGEIVTGEAKAEKKESKTADKK